MSADWETLISLMYTAVDNKTTFNSFYSSAIVHGLSRRRSDMLDKWHDVQAVIASKNAIASVGRDELIPLTDLSKSSFEYTKEFVYKAAVSFQLGKKAPTEQQFVTFISDDKMTKAEIEEAIRLKWPEWESGQGRGVQDINIIEAFHWLGE